MVFLTEKDKRINKLYSELKDLQEGRKVLESAMHKNFYNRELYNQLYLKLNELKDKIEKKKMELNEEKSKTE